MIPLLEEMFASNENEMYYLDSMPNFVLNEEEEWEPLPDSNEIPSDDSCNRINSNASTRQVLASSTYLLSTVSHFFRNINYGNAASSATHSASPSSSSIGANNTSNTSNNSMPNSNDSSGNN